MLSIRYTTILILTIAAALQADNTAKQPPSTDGRWFINAVNTPTDLTPPPGNKKIVVAIVDDGVRITHNDLKDCIWTNPKEIPDNRIDDDGNGYTDDIHGFDVSDNNDTVAPPANRPNDFYHGTHIAGTIAQIIKTAYGKNAPNVISIMPVKALSDTAQHSYIKDGYKGIEYAINAKADIIVCAWGVGHISPEESKILQHAHDKGILVLASAGNFPEGQKKYPAAHDTVMAIAALDQNNLKTAKSNYGGFVGLSAPGIDIESASSLSDSSYELRDGSSMATAITAAAAAILKAQNPTYSNNILRLSLKNSADNIDKINPDYIAQLGAGKLNIKASLKVHLYGKPSNTKHHLNNPQGYLRFVRSNEEASWLIEPYGTFKGIRFHKTMVKNGSGKSIVKFYSDDSPDATLYGSYQFEQMPPDVFVPGTSAFVTLETDSNHNPFLFLEYRAEPIDFSRLYCCDTVSLNTEGTLVDGSGKNNYSNNSDCKWLITAPPGKVIHIKFSEFDTQANTDLLYFFNGAGTHEKIMAIFSGQNIPPELLTFSNQVLVWFVTDTKITGKGFNAEYRFIDQ